MTQEPLVIQDLENYTLFSGTYTSWPFQGVPFPPVGVRELACRLQVQELLSPGSPLVQNVCRNAHSGRVQS